jgi:hypothetical protein
LTEAYRHWRRLFVHIFGYLSLYLIVFYHNKKEAKKGKRREERVTSKGKRDNCFFGPFLPFVRRSLPPTAAISPFPTTVMHTLVVRLYIAFLCVMWMWERKREWKERGA